MRIADDWDDTRERLREAVKMRGYDAVAAEIPVGRRTLFRLCSGETKSPSLPTQECVERMLDERSLKDARRFE